MNLDIRCRSLTVALLASAALTASAQSSFHQPNHIRVNDILGREVRTAEGEMLAIRDLVVDPVTRKVEYLVLQRTDGDARDNPSLYPIGALRSGAGEELLLTLPESSASSGASIPSAHLRISGLARIDEMVVRLEDGTVSLRPGPAEHPLVELPD